MKKLRVLSRIAYRWRYTHFIEGINHGDAVAYVQSEGRMTSRYSFMVTMSCGIAILGLLLSSPTVVIGAMLISPRMSLARFQRVEVRLLANDETDSAN